MLHRLVLRDFVIVAELDLEFSPGFTALTGETGAGKSILVDALQLVLGARSDATVVREGSPRSEISAIFALTGPSRQSITQWLAANGFTETEDELLLRRVVDAQGKSRAWINGSPATVSQLREIGEHLVDIHGQHAWQSLMRPDRVRQLLDAHGGIATEPLGQLWREWRDSLARLEAARQRADVAATERERLAWQIAEVDKLAPGEHEWEEINTEHDRLSHAQMLIDAASSASDAVGDGGASAGGQIDRAIAALEKSAGIDAQLDAILGVLRDAQAQVADASHSLHAWLRHGGPDPDRLAELDARLSQWLGLARRYHRKPEELPVLLAQWRTDLAELEAGADLDALEAAEQRTQAAWRQTAERISRERLRAAKALSGTITKAIQQLGMTGGAFTVAVAPLAEPQASGLDAVEFLVAGHAGATPRPVAKVASGGELSRLALAIAVATSRQGHTPTLIFDEIDAGIGGAVAQTVGALMRQLGADRQVLAVTHLAQVAACADTHLVVSKASSSKGATSRVLPISGDGRVAEIARMLGGEARSATGLAHAREMLEASTVPRP